MQIIVTSHGGLAWGALNTLEFILQDSFPSLYLISLDDKGIDAFQKKFTTVCLSLPLHSFVLVLCDMYGGTPANTAAAYPILHPAHPLHLGIVYNFNLAILLQACELLSTYSTEDGRHALTQDLFEKHVQELAQVGKQQINAEILFPSQKTTQTPKTTQEEL